MRLKKGGHIDCRTFPPLVIQEYKEIRKGNLWTFGVKEVPNLLIFF